MFDIRVEGGRVVLAGRFDAAESERAKRVLDGIPGPITLDCSRLEYISSAGIGVVMHTYKRMTKNGLTLTLSHLNPNVRNTFRYAGLDRVLSIT